MSLANIFYTRLLKHSLWLINNYFIIDILHIQAQ